MFANSSNAVDGYARNSVPDAGADYLRARAERYRRLAELLSDPKIIAVVLDCASELEKHADALSEKQPGHQKMRPN